MTNKLKINLYGETFILKKIVIPETSKIQWESIANKIKKPLHSALIDPFFYHDLNDSAFQSLDDIDVDIWEGLINNSKNKIEIWFKNKKVQILKMDHLIYELLLFPLYNSSYSNIELGNLKGIFIEQKEIGLIGSYEILIDDFIIDNLQFNLLQIEKHLVLNSILYSGENLKLIKKDTLINYQNSYEFN